MLCSCEKTPGDAADKLLSALSDGDAASYALLFDSDSAELSEQERFVLSRMTWECAGTVQTDETHARVTVHIRTYDMMDLMNAALVRSLNGTDGNFDTTAWMLLQLKSGTAPRSDFSADIPLSMEDGAWTLDVSGGEEMLDALRDAVSGGAYSWFRIYRETFGAE